MPTIEDTDGLNDLVGHIKAGRPYSAQRGIEALSDGAGLGADVVAHLINIADVLGHHDDVLRIAGTADSTASLPRPSRTAIARVAAIAGRGDLMTGGTITLKASAGEEELLMYAAQCMAQTGHAGRALDLMGGALRRAVRSHDLVARNAMFVAAHAVDPDDGDAFDDVLRPIGLTRRNSWTVYERLRHTAPTDIDRLPRPTASVFPAGKHMLHFCPSGTEGIDLPGEGGGHAAAPSYTPDSLVETLSTLIDTLRDMMREPWFAERLALIGQTRRHFAPAAGDPVQVISTGRAGTTALHGYLAGSRFEPYHGFVWQLAPRHRWEMLNRLLTGTIDRDGLRPVARCYLRARVSEILAAYRLGRTPVLISHFDVIFAPVLLAAFPDMRFIHMHRAPSAVASSQIGKRQFAMGQLLPLPYRRARASQGARFHLPASTHLPEMVAWYITFTEDFFHALATTHPSPHHIDLRAEDLFEGHAAGFEALAHVFDGPVRSEAETRAHFARKINEKRERAVEDPLTARYMEETETARRRLRAMTRRTLFPLDRGNHAG
ncbi:hypothetical protein KAJ83_11860 [Marivibrio halodurans]|uniref:Sulfotransferase family protein n=1 Tax=Marivibrio halodurans TaxID=2039722 RepID=A0A8J7SNJ9_9PROT|nr:sulfotransferase [Marivibrio halodurans]MBP5857706.1 hypothetical protein [Marivibrio halodurans]